MTNERGNIFVEEAYALGKMLDHSSWWKDEPKLPRKITPSDIDYPLIPLVFDNNGRILFCELSKQYAEWRQCSTGQRWLYQSAIAHKYDLAVLCHHGVDFQTGRKINGRYDVQSFQIMVWDWGYVFSKVVCGNSEWQRFILRFYKSGQAEKIRRFILGKSTGWFDSYENSDQAKIDTIGQ